MLTVLQASGLTVFFRDLKTPKTELNKWRVSLSLIFDEINIQNKKQEFQICFTIKKRYNNERAKEAQALKTCSFSASFPCPGGAPDSR